MTGVNGHGTAGGAVFRFDHQASGTQNTDDIRVQNFYNFFLQPHAAAAPGIRAKWELVEQWWRVACMNVNTGTESKLARRATQRVCQSTTKSSFKQNITKKAVTMAKLRYTIVDVTVYGIQ
jgi:hypothetical protein